MEGTPKFVELRPNFWVVRADVPVYSGVCLRLAGCANTHVPLALHASTIHAMQQHRIVLSYTLLFTPIRGEVGR